MLGSPWDQAEVRLVRTGAEHAITGITVQPEADTDGRFCLVLETEDGRALNLRLPGDRLVELAQVLLRLAGQPPFLDCRAEGCGDG
jgi:hypothetical protein